MVIDKNIAKFLVYEGEAIVRALEKINQNQRRILFVVSADGVLLGSLSDGDVRRWITSVSDVDVNLPVECAMNAKVQWFDFSNQIRATGQEVSGGKDVFPLLDEFKRVKAIAYGDDRSFVVGGREISEGAPTFVIAEIGNNHNGDVELAKEMTRLAVEAGADCVKFQMRDMASLYKNNQSDSSTADLGAEYTLDLLSKFQLSNDELFEVFDYCRELGVPPLCTPWDELSLRALETYGMEFYKVASADFTNHPLLDALCATGKPLICSTGMSTDEEIRLTVQFLQNKAACFVLLHCNSTYPTPFKDINLHYLPRLAKISGGLVGYSGHERGIHIPVAAVTLGAKIVEKHFTIDKSMEGNDHKVSLLPGEFREMVLQIRSTEEAMGTASVRSLTQGEMLNRETLAKSLVARVAMKSGAVVTRDALDVTSPGQGLQPMYMESLIGRTLNRNIEAGGYFYESDLVDTPVEARNYKFNRPFGIPVRYHDYEELVTRSNFDFVEFHLSYQDLNIDLDTIFKNKQNIGFAVHAPELFSGDHLLDLTSQDEAYLARSLVEMNRVCDVARGLKKYFPKTNRPVIVVNVGGFNSDGFISDAEKKAKYERLSESLKLIQSDGVELIIQTMPPFPWHFGGQSFHNLFVSPAEIADFCDRFDYRICLDISHTMMACNHFGWQLSDAVEAVAPFVAHMHVVDAKGSDGEGVQIGEGDVDFNELAKKLSSEIPNVMFLPEVWQGHKNSGEGFWSALQFLEGFEF